MRRTRWNHAAGFKAKVSLAANPDLDPRHERAANLVAEAIAWMAHSSNRWIPEGLTVNGARRRIARRAQEYIEELFREAIRTEDLCREQAVSHRTLQRCFSEYFRITPMHYVKIPRLNAAPR